ncbi:MAG: ATP-dependent DNA helicase RecG [Clostridia bacterium]|nr:ATP-dependent DNA helicase RecG [Clostridia bacterium]
MSDSELTKVKGIGPAKAEKFARLGLVTLRDALEYAPRDYIDLTDIRHVADLRDGDAAAVRVTIDRPPQLLRTRRSMTMVSIRAHDDTGKLGINYFNQSYRANQFSAGERIVFYGRVSTKRGVSMANPMAIRGSEEGILPVYAVTAGISQGNMRDVMSYAIGALGGSLAEPLPDALRAKYSLCGLREAIEGIHFPKGRQALAEACRRFDFERCLAYFYLSSRMGKARAGAGTPLDVSGLIGRFRLLLPFELTGAQLRAVEETARDLSSGRAMSRLVQGDVGCGKTVVALFTMYAAVENGKQAVILAPTEILAQQHYEQLNTVFGARACLLTGSMRAGERRERLEGIRSGRYMAIAGTHALLQERVEYAELCAIVTDEQHRFGVAQRAAMVGKGRAPHVLVMSATPIPRTLALILYGDLDVSVIDELPPGRKPVKTHVVRGGKRSSMYGFIDALAAKGGQTYVVCPAIDDTGALAGVRSADEVYRELKAELQAPVALLHGRLKPDDKREALERFRRGEVKVLVSTTVIEVGVDVRAANAIVVENAERFGLAQLHQLRGRVGRGGGEAYCFLMCDEGSADALERLRLLASTADGFEIARYDLERRGPGEFLGVRQHGRADSSWSMHDLDVRTVKEARDCIGYILSNAALYDDMRPHLEALAERLTAANGGIAFN